MTRTPGKGSLGNRLAMWRALRAQAATGFVSQPEPRSIGLYARGRQLVAGNFQFAGQLVQAVGASIWDVKLDDPGAPTETHGFLWLDDLAALGDSAARTRAQEWTWDWIARFGRGQGPGWTPDLTGRRLIRLINHALLLLQGRDRAQSDAYYRSLSAQVVFLSRRWAHVAPGLPRFEALTGLIYASLALTGMKARVAPAVAALAVECGREIDAMGGIPTRNPEELLEVFTLLTWAEQALSEAGHTPPPALVAALERIAPSLRALRHADGGLARFHGGGRGLEGRLDMALAATGVKPGPSVGQAFAMGFVRMAEARTTVIIDAARPPGGAAGVWAHASTAAFELTSGRRPVIVSCGSGAPFGADWRQAGRATASHATLAVDGFSSSRLKPGPRVAFGRDALVDCAQVTSLRQGQLPDGLHLYMAHSGWSVTHGLSHSRELLLTKNGRKLAGTDALIARTQAERARFERLMNEAQLQGAGFAVRFHLHPDVDATLDMGGAAVSLALKSGEIWVFRHDGFATLSLEPSVYLEKGRLKPRPTRQIVLSARAVDPETRIGWTLAKAQDTPLAIRDLDRDEMPVPI
ncbi:heparinase II/III family protein [Cypionkella sp.]|uniref:heparinase II/III family protein n=1 Tax=Cypionkella sp. TaxID=2811411 RepID=UPI0026291379|nr:heparinase II/III family protein [Cypionkella sp.]MDB5664811.1 heparinase [Cypionkella sp.]